VQLRGRLSGRTRCANGRQATPRQSFGSDKVLYRRPASLDDSPADWPTRVLSSLEMRWSNLAERHRESPPPTVSGVTGTPATLMPAHKLQRAGGQNWAKARDYDVKSRLSGKSCGPVLVGLPNAAGIASRDRQVVGPRQD